MENMEDALTVLCPLCLEDIHLEDCDYVCYVNGRTGKVHGVEQELGCPNCGEVVGMPYGLWAFVNEKNELEVHAQDELVETIRLAGSDK